MLGDCVAFSCIPFPNVFIAHCLSTGRIPPSVEIVQYNLAVLVELRQFVARFYTVVCFIDLKSREDSLKPVRSTLYVKFFMHFFPFAFT